ncbi:BTB/POZ and MATH domain-containing protein 1-like [Panicum miliaceum]|uniref:BTB/POZ and MATH domain-containing protein 1-like n=1 Tax=Panicum miliaceum TaxID=4540 RepID=A0A3L6RL65_PANMI|nr:BTB/POZ and MATH domain-containing protein 1-like [Panicum miliaceum]
MSLVADMLARFVSEVVKRSRTPRLERRTIDSAFHELRVDHEQTKHLAAGTPVSSDAFPAGGYMWRVKYFPQGFTEADKGYVSIFFGLLSKASVSAICQVFVKGKDGHLCSSDLADMSGVQLFPGPGVSGWSPFLSQPDLEEHCLTEGHVTFVCAIMVVRGSSIPVPALDIGKHLGTLLETTDGADVSFTIGTETFRAHRAVLAARSPVLRAELLGSMAETTMPDITLHDIAPATFRVMLRFMYTDALPADNELGDSPSEMMKDLLAAADRYALERLKLLCAQKLWEAVSADTVASTLAFAETYSCPELKSMCIGFFATGENFQESRVDEGFRSVGAAVPFNC